MTNSSGAVDGGRGREPLEMSDRARGQAGHCGDFTRDRSATEFAFESSRRATHQRDLGPRVTREGVQSAEFIDDSAADADVAIRPCLFGRTVEAQERFDQGDLARAREIVTRDMRR